jgi:hypothetical protein
MEDQKEWNQRLIVALQNAISAHESGNYQELDKDYEELDTQLPRLDDPGFRKAYIALELLGGWIDASNHNWQYYNGIRKEDWPRLGKTIIDSLSTEQEIADELIIKHFGSIRK